MLARTFSTLGYLGYPFQLAWNYFRGTAAPAAATNETNPPPVQGPNSYLNHVTNSYGIMRNQLGLLGFCNDLNQQYSANGANPVPFSFFGDQAVLVTHPDQVRQIFTQYEKFSRVPKFKKAFERGLGFSVITAPEEDWQHISARIKPQLKGQHLQKILDIMTKAMNDIIIPSWGKLAQSGESFDVFQQMLTYASTAVFCGFLDVPSETVSAEVHRALNDLFVVVRERIFAPFVLPSWVPTPHNRLYNQSQALVQGFVKPQLDANLTKDTLAGSIIRGHTTFEELTDEAFDEIKREIDTQFSAAASGLTVGRLKEIFAPKLEEGEGSAPVTLNTAVEQIKRELGEDKEWNPASEKLTRILAPHGQQHKQHIMEEIVSMLLGGSETTIIMMSWAWYYLAQNPAMQYKIAQELATLAHAEDTSALPKDILNKAPYLSHVMKEVLRLRGPAFLNTRIVNEDTQLNIGSERTLDLKKGTIIFVSPYITQQDKLLWGTDADQFNPDRYNSRHTKEGSEFYPFGAGRHICPGQLFALNEAAIAIGLLIKQGYRVALAPKTSHDMGMIASTTLRPAEPIMLIASKVPVLQARMGEHKEAEAAPLASVSVETPAAVASSGNELRRRAM